MKVIVLTSKFDPDIREKFIDKGVVDYILKKSMKSVLYIIPLINRLIHNKNHLALVVDDSKIACQHVSYLLEKQYIRTIHASSGIEAINKLKQNPDITLIVADYRMPEMDGVEMVQEIRETYDKSRIAIIGISGFDDYHITAQFLKAGANDFLRKPFNHEEFYCRIHQVLDMNEATSNLYRLANQDDLTGLWNRRYLFQKANESEKAQCLAMIDIDLFKDVNDTYGHDAGDHVLIQVADILRNNFENSIIARFGGEEFCVLHVGPYQGFVKQLERTRQIIEKTAFEYSSKRIKITVSIGSTDIAGSLEDQIKSADRRLYQAKEKGRNVTIDK